MFNYVLRKARVHRSNLGAGIASSTVAFFLSFSLSSSFAIASAFALICTAIPALISRERSRKKTRIWSALWPELLEHVISGLQSGLSIEQALSALGSRGPEVTRYIFQGFASDLRAHVPVESALARVKTNFDSHVADQVCEVLILSKSSGARDTATTLRTLSDYLRAENVLADEIHAKQSWIRNSATIAAVAPWLLLLLLSTQSNTVAAYKSPIGFAILLGGIGCTVVAYIWMNRVARVEVPPRVFGAR